MLDQKLICGMRYPTAFGYDNIMVTIVFVVGGLMVEESTEMEVGSFYTQPLFVISTK